MISFIANRVGALNGADLMSRYILGGLAGSGLPIALVSSERREDIGNLGIPLGSVRWVPAPSCVTNSPMFPGHWVGRLASLAQNCIGRWRDGPHLKQISSQGMVVNGFSNHWIFRFVSLPATTPRVLIVHDSPRRFDLEGQPPLGWALEKMARYSHFIFCSQRVAGEWMDLEELAGKVHCCIPNCCREDEVRQVMKQERAAVRKQLRLPAHRFVVVCPASIQYRKGQDLLVDSMPILLKAVPDLLFYLVGEPIGDWSAALKKRITAAGYGNQIHLMGARKDALDFIYAADALVLPARSEAAPLVVLEAMALKTPILAAAVGGVPDMLEHGHSGLLFGAEDRNGLVEALTRLAKKPLLRKTLAENASRRYWTQFSRNQMSTHYAAALRHFVSGSQGYCPDCRSRYGRPLASQAGLPRQV